MEDYKIIFSDKTFDEKMFLTFLSTQQKFKKY